MNYKIFIIGILFWVNYSSIFASEKIKIACIGNSVTESLNLPKGKDYPRILQQYLGDRYDVRNFGVSGATLLFNGHKPYVKSEKYIESLNFAPDIVIISLGLNDTDPRNWPNYGEQFVDDYNKLIEAYINVNKSTKVYICLNTPIFSGHKRFLSGTRDWYDNIQERIKYISTTRNLPLIDLKEPLYNRIDLFNDYIHPSEEGTTRIAERIFQHLIAPEYPLSIDPIYGEGMVLQREKEVYISGKGKAYSTVSLSFKNETLNSRVDSLGHWKITLNAQHAGGPYTFKFNSDQQLIQIDSVYFGDVYFASGQSNMAFTLKSDTAQYKRVATRNTWSGHIRYYKNNIKVITNKVALDSSNLNRLNSLDYFEGKWSSLNTSAISNYSAIGIAYLDALNQHMPEIPIAIIEMAVGGSNIESWIDRKTLEYNPITASYIHNWLTSDFIQDFCRERAALNLKNSSVKNARHPYQPAYNYEAGIQRWKNYPIKAVLWYQGESNAHNVELHELLFPMLLDSWRKTWLSPQLPFYYVQLSSINRPSWPAFRHSQYEMEKSLKRAWLVPSHDLGDSLDVHPKNKYSIGLRLSQAVRATLFNEKPELLAPKLRRVSKGNKTLTLTFEHVQRFILANSDTRPIGFELVNINGKVIKEFSVELKRKDIIITVPDSLESYIQIRYAYQPYSRSNIYNENLIPIPTFKIDI